MQAIDCDSGEFHLGMHIQNGSQFDQSLRGYSPPNLQEAEQRNMTMHNKRRSRNTAAAKSYMNASQQQQ